MANYRLDLPGIGNARELGGRAVGNRTVKTGVLLRTARIDQAEPEAIRRLEREYRVQTVVDFRMAEEQRQMPDPVIHGAENRRAPVLELEDTLVLNPGLQQTFGGSEADAAEKSREMLAMYNDPKADRMAMFNMMYDYGMLDDSTYLLFLLGERGKSAYRAFFDALLHLEPGRAVLWHCADGKDRTGCAAMLLLFALGASRETVMEDYLLTNVCNARKLDAVRQRVAPLNFEQKKLDTLLFVSGGVAEGYMNRAIDTLVEQYGSVTGYLAQELGIDESGLEALRTRFLV
jgi:protein-tyrosine phosphatase